MRVKKSLQYIQRQSEQLSACTGVCASSVLSGPTDLCGESVTLIFVWNDTSNLRLSHTFLYIQSTSRAEYLVFRISMKFYRNVRIFHYTHEGVLWQTWMFVNGRGWRIGKQRIHSFAALHYRKLLNYCSMTTTYYLR